MNGTRADQIDVTATREQQTHALPGSDLRGLLLSVLPIAGGVAAAAALHALLGRGIPEASLTWIRVLAAAWAWLYLGFGLRLGWVAGGANLLVSAGIFGAAVLTRDAGADSVVVLLAVHAVWSLVLSWMSREDADSSPSVWLASGVFHGALASALVLG